MREQQGGANEEQGRRMEELGRSERNRGARTKGFPFPPCPFLRSEVSPSLSLPPRASSLENGKGGEDEGSPSSSLPLQREPSSRLLCRARLLRRRSGAGSKGSACSLPSLPSSFLPSLPLRLSFPKLSLSPFLSASSLLFLPLPLGTARRSDGRAKRWEQGDARRRVGEQE